MNRSLSLAVAMCLLAAGAAGAAEPPASGGLPFLSAPAPALPSPLPPHSDAADAATYQRCMTLARDDPQAGKKLAQAWQQRGGFHPAEHCLAIALIGLKQYKEAALRLDSLAQAMIHAPAGLRAGVLGQAAQAWLLAGDAGRAYASDSAALSLAPDDLDLSVDRAEAAGEAGWFDKAVADLDHVLKAAPTRLDALIYRASAHRSLGHLDAALADADAALKLAPDSVSALLERGNIRRLRGDPDGARADWRRVSELAPGSAAATAAAANIARLATLADPGSAKKH
jgi:tetratricopeptide (TPR) repeat protein